MDESTFLERYNKLNDEQRRAVDTVEGPVMVIAGPGSGKTELLSVRVANILRTQDVLPSNILCLTFTDAAAVNMRQRLAGLIGSEAYRVAIHTFHGFGTDIIGRFPEYFYRGASFRAADELAQIEILETILSDLPLSDPLASRHEEAFTYLSSVQRSISDLKKAGLTPDDFGKVLQENDAFLRDAAESVASLFGRDLRRTKPEDLLQLAQSWLAQAPEGREHLRLGQQSSLAALLGEGLLLASSEYLATGKTPAVTAWKSDHTKKDATGRQVLREAYYQTALQSLQKVYAAYRQQLHARKYFDYDDMLLDVLQAMETQSPLRYAVQEQYQFILVDEFQDTNDAQMRLLGYLTDAPVYEGRPNIMVVGDDDQAIYKFQGANVANIQQFRRRFVDPEQIILTKNYRSTQDILDLARGVIELGEGRLESVYADVAKRLEAAGKVGEGKVAYTRYATRAHEFAQVTQQIKQAIADGQKPSEIAVITRWHGDLQDFALYLQNAGVPVRYEKQRNVLAEPHIHQLIQMSKFVWLLARKMQPEADDLLPEILSYPFWKLDRKTLWHLSAAAGKASGEGRLWLSQMDESENPKLKNTARWFLELRGRAETESVEKILEYLMGAHTPLLVADESAEEDEGAGVLETTAGVADFVSPFKDYYFDELKKQSERNRYISFLSALQTFMDALRAYRPGEELRVGDLLQFVNLRQTNNLPVTDTSPYVSGVDAVQLLSAHKAKGLEFESVFVISCQQSTWTRGGRADLLPFPSNLPISSEADSLDDWLRIFYVALTRAKRNLYLSGHRQSENGSEAEPLAFLAGIEHAEAEQLEVEMADSVEVLELAWQRFNQPPYEVEEKAVLLPLVENYALSVTHLNDFLDLRHAGPQRFLEDHVLRFPQPQSLPQIYGTAVHGAVRQLFAAFRHDGVLPSLDYLVETFDGELRFARLEGREYEQLRERGHDELSLYYAAQSEDFKVTDVVELDFRQQQVMVGEAQVTGKIDRVQVGNNGLVHVHDLKTGRPHTSWDKGSADDKYKLHQYMRQLLFYKLLIEGSRDFGKKWRVESGQLDFLRPLGGEFVELKLESMDDGELRRLKRLIEIIYQHVKEVNFPDTSSYSADVKGSIQFEEDLLEGRI